MTHATGTTSTDATVTSIGCRVENIAVTSTDAHGVSVTRHFRDHYVNDDSCPHKRIYVPARRQAQRYAELRIRAGCTVTIHDPTIVTRYGDTHSNDTLYNNHISHY